MLVFHLPYFLGKDIHRVFSDCWQQSSRQRGVGTGNDKSVKATLNPMFIFKTRLLIFHRFHFQVPPLAPPGGKSNSVEHLRAVAHSIAKKGKGKVSIPRASQAV